MKPSVGRIVHFTRYNKCCAAIITETEPIMPSVMAGEEFVSLTVFPDSVTMTPVGHNEERQNGTWHWPERVE